MLTSCPPNEQEVDRIQELGKYNVLEGSWSNTRSIYVRGVHVGFYVVYRDYLHFFHVFKKYRRRGFGRAAVNALTIDAPSLYLYSTPAARTFWRQCGFKVVGDGSSRACVEMRFSPNT